MTTPFSTTELMGRFRRTRCTGWMSAGGPLALKPRMTRSNLASQHGTETAVSGQLRCDKIPGQYGCAARDLNPEPAD
jgi:hypothetical protein